MQNCKSLFENIWNTAVSREYPELNSAKFGLHNDFKELLVLNKPFVV